MNVPDGHYAVPLGTSAIRREGAALTILAYGTMVHVAMTAAAETGIDAEIMDTVMTAQREAESHGTLHAGGRPSVRDMFEGVYATMPPHLRRQRQAAGF